MFPFVFNDLSLAIGLCLLAEKAFGGIRSMSGVLNRLFPEYRVFSVTEAEGPRPSYVFADNEGRSHAIIALNGLVPALHTQYLLNQWRSLSVHPQSGLALQVLQDAEGHFQLPVLTDVLSYQALSRVTLYGHSYGGLWAHAIAQVIKNARPSVDVEIATFGTPRIIRGNRDNFWGGFRINRVMATGDIVPNLPPHINDPNNSPATRFLAAQFNWQGLGHSKDGWLYPDTDQPPERQTNGDTFVSGIGLNVVAWFTENLRGASGTHSWSRYMEWFYRILLASQTPPLPPDQPFVGPLPQEEPMTQAAITQAGNEAAAELAMLIRNAEFSGNRRLTAKPFTKEREGRYHYLVFAGHRVAFFRTAHPANAAMRKGNSLFYNIGKSSGLDGTSWIEGFDDFLVQVSEGEGWYDPPLPVM